MEKSNLIILGSLAFLLVVSVVFFIFSSGNEKIKDSTPSELFESEAVSTEPPESLKVTLFFLSERDSLLHAEDREILADPALSRRAAQVVHELIRGSLNGLVSPFPPETKLRELFISQEGIAYVDFSREIRENHPFGSTADIATIYSVVNSLTHNFDSIRRVFILIEGREQETLGGHIDLSRAFLPRKDMVAK
jgi:spore germination protein GerM